MATECDGRVIEVTKEDKLYCFHIPPDWLDVREEVKKGIEKWSERFGDLQEIKFEGERVTAVFERGTASAKRRNLLAGTWTVSPPAFDA